MSGPTNRRRRRRSGPEVRGLMLHAAREVFAAKGFGATTREIAERATVTEQLLFNHFGSKEQLFTAAVLHPFNELVEQQLEDWQHVLAAGDDPRALVRPYVEGLWRLVRDNRALLQALDSDVFGAHVTPVLDRLQQLTTEIKSHYHYTYDPYLAVRFFFAAITTLALHQESLANRSETDVIDELVSIFTGGLTQQ